MKESKRVNRLAFGIIFLLAGVGFIMKGSYNLASVVEDTGMGINKVFTYGFLIFGLVFTLIGGMSLQKMKEEEGSQK